MKSTVLTRHSEDKRTNRAIYEQRKDNMSLLSFLNRKGGASNTGPVSSADPIPAGPGTLIAGGAGVSAPSGHLRGQYAAEQEAAAREASIATHGAPQLAPKAAAKRKVVVEGLAALAAQETTRLGLDPSIISGLGLSRERVPSKDGTRILTQASSLAAPFSAAQKLAIARKENVELATEAELATLQAYKAEAAKLNDGLLLFAHTSANRARVIAEDEKTVGAPAHRNFAHDSKALGEFMAGNLSRVKEQIKALDAAVYPLLVTIGERLLNALQTALLERLTFEFKDCEQWHVRWVPSPVIASLDAAARQTADELDMLRSGFPLGVMGAFGSLPQLLLDEASRA